MSKKPEEPLRVGTWRHFNHITPTVLLALAVLCTPLAIIAEYLYGESTFATMVSSALFGGLVCSVLAWLLLFLPGYFIFGYFYNLKK